MLFLLIIWPGIFYFPHPGGAAVAGEVMINEIAWMGTPGNANAEWIELRNMTDGAVDLAGWTIKAIDGQPDITLTGNIEANGNYIMERTSDDTVVDITADLVYTGALGNTGESLVLADAGGVAIDTVDALTGWPAGDNTAKKTMERREDGVWQTSAEAGGTPRTVNSGGSQETVHRCGDGTKDAGEECDDGNTVAGDGCTADCKVETDDDGGDDTDSGDEGKPESGSSSGSSMRAGSVMINEFVSDPADNEVEWVELYATVSSELGGCALADGSGAQTALSGSLESGRFRIVEKPKGNLNNAGDRIALVCQGTTIDQVAYGNWDDGLVSDNAPMADDPNAVARWVDGLSSGNGARDFAITTVPTRGAANRIVEPVDEAEADGALPVVDFDRSATVVISEVLPNPAGDETAGEFIELFNEGKESVNLTGWRLGDDSSARHTIKPGADGSKPAIAAGAYLVLYRKTTKLALNNGGDSVSLYQPLSDTPLDTVRFETAAEGNAYALATSSGGWAWTETPTAGKANIIQRPNRAPTADFEVPIGAMAGVPVRFDSGDTADDDGDALTYRWQFGDGATSSAVNPEHGYAEAGSYKVTLTVDDGRASDERTRTVRVKEGTASVSVAGWSEEMGDLRLSEFLPDPEGDDAEEEWIELFNSGEIRVNLRNWRLDDSEGGSTPYTLKDEFWLDAGRYFVVPRQDSGLALNNTDDAVRLYRPDGSLSDSVAYGATDSGFAYARTASGAWQWTSAPTPGEANRFVIMAGKTGANRSSGGSKSTSGKAVREMTLESVRTCEPGDRVRVSGTVAVLPGIFGSQYFYIVGSPGLQVYSYKKDFPALKVGDKVTVSGELSSVAGELRLKTSVAADIALAGAGEAPVPAAIGAAECTEEAVGSLVRLSGEVVARKGSSVFLDDGTDEAVVYVKQATGIDAKSFAVGESVAVTGILGRTSSGVRLMPRSPDDVVHLARDEGEVLGETLEDGMVIPARGRYDELVPYAVIIGLGAFFLSGWFWWRKRQGTPSDAK